jgi:hypothetical protein
MIRVKHAENFDRDMDIHVGDARIKTLYVLAKVTQGAAVG